MAQNAKSPAVTPGERAAQGRLLGDGAFLLEAVGESFYGDSFQTLFGPKTEEGVKAELDARLVFENENSHDPQAVPVLIDDLKVGHLSRLDARELRTAAEESGKGEADLAVRVLVTGGWFRWDGSEGSYGVRIDAVRPFRFEGASAP